MNEFDPRDVESVAGNILRAGPICDECLGRIASRLGTGLSNAERGRRIRAHVAATGVSSASGACWVCDNAFDDTDRWAREAARLAGDMEFSTYLFGVKLTPKQEQMETFYEERFVSPHREPIKHSLNRVLGIAFERAVTRAATVDFTDPQVSFVVDLSSQCVSMHVRSLYLYGRYRKLERGIPQTKWPCRACRGRGCEACGFTGKQYPTSVEELIGEPLRALALAKSIHLHGAGREDIDARMLGDGRPFVMELVSPRRRSIDLAYGGHLVREHAGEAVAIGPLRFAKRRAVKWVKTLRARKRYHAEVKLEQAVPQQLFEAAVGALVGEIAQRTPQRVAHRRADLVRRRTLYSASGTLQRPTEAGIDFDGDGGLYIKELVSGDEGRTVPSLTERLGVDARVVALDVLGVDAPDLPPAMELPDGLS